MSGDNDLNENTTLFGEITTDEPRCDGSEDLEDVSSNKKHHDGETTVERKSEEDCDESDEKTISDPEGPGDW